MITKYLIQNEFPYHWNFKYNLKKSLSKANLDNAKTIIIIGENEYKNNFFTLKKLNSGEQFELKLDEINKFLND